MIAIETVAETETVIETVTVTAEGPTVAAATAIAIVTATVAAVALDVITDREFFFFFCVRLCNIFFTYKHAPL